TSSECKLDLHNQSNMSSSPKIEHVILFKIKDNAEPSEVNNTVNLINGMSSLNEVLHLTAAPLLRVRSSIPSLAFTRVPQPLQVASRDQRVRRKREPPRREETNQPSHSRCPRRRLVHHRPLRRSRDRSARFRRARDLLEAQARFRR
ncbi:hypothetical protein PanWU01x14_192070, partial [Parasponia andersonii]